MKRILTGKENDLIYNTMRIVLLYLKKRYILTNSKTLKPKLRSPLQNVRTRMQKVENTKQSTRSSSVLLGLIFRQIITELLSVGVVTNYFELLLEENWQDLLYCHVLSSQHPYCELLVLLSMTLLPA